MNILIKMKKSKELIIVMKEITLDHISSDSYLFATRASIHNYSWGMATAFKCCKQITKKEFNEFSKWLEEQLMEEIEVEENVGTFWKPKYKTKKFKRWKRW